jgi:peptidoglycan DL-endopeptidase LytE
MRMWRGGVAPALALVGVLWASSAVEAGQVYVVRAGDTLWRISHHLGVRPLDLAAANHLVLTATIHPGLRLAVPDTAPPATAQVTPPPTGPVPERGRIADPPVRLHAAPVSPGPARIAVGLLGRPYRWSGVGNRGFDCSGLVVHVFAALGRPLPHSSFEQYQVGTLVSRWALVPGDLVFFQTYSAGASHVGIYIGEDRFIHASYSRGVVVSSIEEPYYRDRFLGGRRI